MSQSQAKPCSCILPVGALKRAHLDSRVKQGSCACVLAGGHLVAQRVHEGRNVAVAGEAEVRCADLAVGLPVGHHLPVRGLGLGSLRGGGARRHNCGRLTCISTQASPPRLRSWQPLVSSIAVSRGQSEETYDASQTCGDSLSARARV